MAKAKKTAKPQAKSIASILYPPQPPLRITISGYAGLPNQIAQALSSLLAAGGRTVYVNRRPSISITDDVIITTRSTKPS